MSVERDSLVVSGTTKTTGTTKGTMALTFRFLCVVGQLFFINFVAYIKNCVMLFNSLAFLLFFPIVVLLYWILPHRYRNLMLLVASYYFYMNWEPIYALLILGSTVVTYLCSLGIDKTQGKSRKTYIYI